jgi:hypothetical protein
MLERGVLCLVREGGSEKDQCPYVVISCGETSAICQYNYTDKDRLEFE